MLKQTRDVLKSVLQMEGALNITDTGEHSFTYEMWGSLIEIYLEEIAHGPSYAGFGTTEEVGGRLPRPITIDEARAILGRQRGVSMPEGMSPSPERPDSCDPTC